MAPNPVECVGFGVAYAVFQFVCLSFTRWACRCNCACCAGCTPDGTCWARSRTRLANLCSVLDESVYHPAFVAFLLIATLALVGIAGWSE